MCDVYLQNVRTSRPNIARPAFRLRPNSRICKSPQTRQRMEGRLALIEGFRRAAAGRPKLHPTRVTCFWSVLPDEGLGVLLQMDTRGSDDRANPGKQSQTLQLDAAGAKELIRILKVEFNLS